MVDSRFWDGVAERLSGGHTVILPDLPLGAHQRPVVDSRSLTPSSVADAVVDVVDALGLSTVTLVGNDTGGAICQMVTARYPDRVERLILTSCDAFANFTPWIVRPFLWLGYLPPALRLVAWAFSSTGTRTSPLWKLFARTGYDPATVQDWMRPVRWNRAIRRDLGHLFRSITPADTLAAAARLRGYRGETLIAWSRDDLIFPARDAQRLAELIPNARLEWIHGSRTFAPIEKPQQLADLIATFTNDTSVTAGGSSARS